MPTKPRSRCTSCKTLHDGSGLCPTCRREASTRRAAKRGTRQERGLGADHKRAAAQILADATVCAMCGLPPTPTDPLTAGHIVAREDGGTNDLDNYQPEHRSCNSRKVSPYRYVVLVTGPPCAGKSTYVLAHAQAGDTVLDLDEIARSLGSTRQWQHDPTIMAKADRVMRGRVAALRSRARTRTWVIRSVPSGKSRAALARLITATEVIVLLPDPGVLVSRALERPDRLATIEAINSWRSAYTDHPDDLLIAMS